MADDAANVALNKRESVLFICANNSCRSQMAEALLRSHHGDRYEAFSAGSQPSVVDPNVVKVLREKEIDISTAVSKTLDEFKGHKFDFVVTLCDEGDSSSPSYPAGKHQLKHPFPDPKSFQGNDEERLTAYRELRNQLKAWIDTTFGKKEEPKKVEEEKKTVMKVEMDG